MGKGYSIQPDQVYEVKSKKEKYPSITNHDLAKMCGMSDETTRRIIKGEYDFMLTGTPQTAPQNEADFANAIDVASSDICDTLNHNRTILSDFAGAASAEEIQTALVFMNRQLFTIGHMLAALLDPETKSSKQMCDHFKNELKADTINGGKRR